MQSLIDTARPVPIFRRLSFQLGLIVFALAFLLYAKTGSFGYAWDDAIVITENPRVQQGFSNLGSHWELHNSGILADQNGYRPVVMTSFAVEFGLFGANPGISHLLNAVFYGLLCALVFLVLARLFPGKGSGFHCLVALLFAMHPLHVEAVANIKSRDEIFSMGFSLLSLLLLLRFYDFRKPLAMLGSVLAFALAFLSKESALAFLAVMGMAILTQQGTMRRKLVAVLPLPVLLIAAYWMISWVVGGRPNATVEPSTGIFAEDKSLGNAMFAAANTTQFIPTGIALMLRYVKQFLFPWPLVYYSGYDQIPLVGWTSPWVLGSLAVFGLWLGVAIGFWKKDKVPAFALVAFVAYMAIYGHFIRVLSDLMADRFMLAPSLGLCLMLGWLIAKLTRFDAVDAKESTLKSLAKSLWINGKGFFLAISLFVLIFAWRSWDRIPVWRDNLSLFEADMPNLERCARCHVYYAGALLQEFEKGKIANAPKIEEHYRKAIAITPKVYNGRIELAQFLYNQKRYADGVEVMKACLQQFPEAPRAYYFLGYGQYFSGKYAEAAKNLQKSVEMAPLRQDAPYFLAWALYFEGKQQEAIGSALNSIAKFPQNDQFRDALSDFYFGSGEVESGFEVLKSGISSLQSPLLYRKIIQRYTESNQPENAQIWREKAKNQGVAL